MDITVPYLWNLSVNAGALCDDVNEECMGNQ